MIVNEHLGVFFVHGIYGHDVAADNRFRALDRSEKKIIVHFYKCFIFIYSLIEILLWQGFTDLNILVPISQ